LGEGVGYTREKLLRSAAIWEGGFPVTALVQCSAES
jgi:hypothetical protein